MLEPGQLREELVGFVRAFAGGDEAQVDTLKGQLSTRRYHRVATAGQPRSCVVMELPDDARADGETRLPFLNLHRYLSARRYPVPKIYRAEVARGLIAIEDLGDETLEAAVGHCRSAREKRALYLRAISLIVRLQQLGQKRPDPGCLAFGRRFDYKLLRWELDHFREWLLQVERKVVPGAAEREILDRSFDFIADTLASAETVLVHRDFQSRNLMVTTDGRGRRQIRVIDFQDALLGPRVYDLVALLRDSYLEVEPELIDAALEAYAAQTGLSNVSHLTYLFRLQTVQRKLKDAGRFVFIDRVRGIPDFLSAIPLSLRYVEDALSGLRDVPELTDLRALLARHVFSSSA